jgi:hypothetical protein
MQGANDTYFIHKNYVLSCRTLVFSRVVSRFLPLVVTLLHKFILGTLPSCCLHEDKKILGGNFTKKNSFLLPLKDDSLLVTPFLQEQKVPLSQIYVWHGTRKNSPHQVVAHGLRISYAKDGQCGRGLYGTMNLSYANSYSHNQDRTKVFLLCRFLLGTCCKLRDCSNSFPPEDGHSVYHDQDDYYVVYNDDQVYPEYIAYCNS